MSTPNKQTAEELREGYRNMEIIIPDQKDVLAEKLAEELSIARINFEDLISGPDSELGPNQITLREVIIQLTLLNCFFECPVFKKEAVDISPDDLAKEILPEFKHVLLIIKKGILKI